MSVDYDLVVIGNTPAGVEAASFAAQFNARVALVDQSLDYGEQNYAEAIYSRTLGSHRGEINPSEWTKEVLSNLQANNSLNLLAAQGVDVILGSGEFCRLPQPAFLVNHRRLRSRSYLIATGSIPVSPEVAGLGEVAFLTPQDLWRTTDWQSLGQNLVIVGSSPFALQLAQNLGYWGKKVTLVTSEAQILPQEDPEAAILIQGQLEAEGINIFTNAPVTQVKQINHHKWLQAGNKALETEEIIWVAQRKPRVEDLNLGSVGVEIGQKGIVANEKLQTTNPKIYVCGDVAGGYQLSHIALYEAHIAVKNALFLPIHKVDYLSLPWVMFTEPNLARVGMSEKQAIKRYGKDVFVVRQYFKDNPQALVLGETTGLCKFILHRKGTILGAVIVGKNAGELIGAIALAIKYKIKLVQLADLPAAFPTLSEILSTTAQAWQGQRLKNNRSWRNFLDFWFNCRRNWF